MPEVTGAGEWRVEIYSQERRAAFVLENAVDGDDYESALEVVRRMGENPDRIPHDPPES